MSDIQVRHQVTGVATLKLKYGTSERKISIGLFGQLAPVQAQAFRQLCQSQAMMKRQNSNVPLQSASKSLRGATIYKYNPDFGFWFGDVQNIIETPVKSEQAKLDHFQYCLTSFGSDANVLSNVFVLVSAQKVEYLNEKHVVFGQLMDSESVQVAEELKKFVVVEGCDRVSENSEVLITEVQFEEK
ncbi:Peptidyl-prolyl_cis-trans isomerase B [Hexamita inflata]|uniref:Peptidyl-prolyl cis-trans isomerase B n=1 Tax=Hexamita inflata TaxID=28002 RepID=A0AA86QUJ3_9EUKA|nr:Peptidyl-prolyl cis-trans isomerase B [Hexamita inflata]CAI9957949.1 Peptidyl-prolyl cis-trans isomerase B [Hexamita inflata]CAI9959629.1 Peptidyl-prolyl cis-trans isomerase B [Hexamita inflata]CAI9968680.1 Peptidyl-prolyl cis-trans isomerase B [Hexamita inflata]CAI9969092.1 Peptidyl-prolyl cis-trans isomerase B [Hexamita inflata]